MDISSVILESLTTSDAFIGKALPYIKEEYFPDLPQQLIFRVVKNYIDKHHALADAEVILIDVEKERNVSADDYDAIVEMVTGWKEPKPEKSLDWLLEETESWCQDRAFYLAVKKSTTVLDQSQSKARGELPDLMRDALSVSFDTHIGHDYFRDWENRWKYYTDPLEKIPFDIDLLNNMTEDGIEKKTLNVIMGGIHSGKTRTLCHFAAAYAAMGLNVVYFTMEMAEYKIAQRIDANILGVAMDELKRMSHDNYQRAMENARRKTKGRVIVKEFGTGSAHAGHFRHVLRELRNKQNFVVDVIVVDYINICASARIKAITGDSYTLVKTIAEELRGLGQEFNVPVWSATQVTRAAFGSSDPDMDDVAESWGLPATCDWLGAIVVDDNLIQMSQFILKQVKSRYSDKNRIPKGTINFDNRFMRLTNAPNPSSGFHRPADSPNAPALPPPEQTESVGIDSLRHRARPDFSSLNL